MNRLREFRLAGDQTQEELALRAGCTPATISRIENGSRGGSIRLRVRICAALKPPRPTSEVFPDMDWHAVADPDLPTRRRKSA